MSKSITLLALVLGGAATYAWLHKSESGDIQGQVEGVVSKVRSAFSNDDAVKDAAGTMQDEAKGLMTDMADRVEEAKA